MNLYFPGRPDCLKYCRANLIAASIDSDPPLKDLTKFSVPGVTDPSFSTKSRVTSAVPCIGGAKLNRSNWRAIASITLG